MKKKKTEKKLNIKKIKRGIIDFTKLLWACITYKMIFLLIAIIFVVYSFSEFERKIQKRINDNTEDYLESMVSESLEKIQIRINDEFIVLNMIAVLYDGENEKDIENTKDKICELMGVHDFVGIQIRNNDRDIVLELGNNYNIESESFYDKLYDGKETVSPIVVDEENDKEYISLGVPIYDEENFIGVLTCNYDIDEFTKILDTSSFGQLGTILISQEDGTLVARPESVGKNTNLFTLLDSININNEKSIQKLKKSIKNGQSGIITYGEENHKRYICYNSVPDTEWYSVSIVSASEIEPVVKKVSNLAVRFSAKMFMVFIIYIVITLGIDIRLLKKKRNEDTPI